MQPPSELFAGHASEGSPNPSPPTALVTGGAKRIGSAFVRALAGSGWRVIIHCNTSRDAADALAAELATTASHPPLVAPGDLASPTIGRDLFAGLPPVSLLVNNASRFEDDQLESFETDLWDAHMAINLRAPALLTQAFARQLPDGTGGLVVNLLDAKLVSPNPDFLSYTVSKMALHGFTELAARALAPRIRVNAIAPAVTLVSGPQTRENFVAAHIMNPLGRGVEVEHLVSALGYLVGTPTVTGQTLVIDSGQRFLALPRDVAYMAES